MIKRVLAIWSRLLCMKMSKREGRESNLCLSALTETTEFVSFSNLNETKWINRLTLEILPLTNHFFESQGREREWKTRQSQESDPNTHKVTQPQNMRIIIIIRSLHHTKMHHALSSTFILCNEFDFFKTNNK